MVKITGAREHAARLRRLTDPAMIRGIGAALQAVGEMVEKDAEISITTGATTGKHHVASRPGEPPNGNWGDLVRGIETVQVAPLRVGVTSSAAVPTKPWARPSTQERSPRSAPHTWR